MALPHLILAGVLGYVSRVVAIISWFVVVFTGRLPAGLAGFQVLTLRYNARANAYAGFLHDAYPPFAFDTSDDDPGGTPVHVRFQPQLENRNRLTVALRLILVIPAGLFAFVIGLIAWICHIISFFSVLFTGRWPEALRRWIVSALGVGLRLNAYFLLLTDEYPPFSLDD